MRIFVGYGYNDRDRWIEEYVLPLIRAFGSDIAHGKVVYGGVLSEEVVKLIRASDAMIGFTTRRDLDSAGQYRTHEWVIQELTTANGQDPRIPWVEVREDGVIAPGGILGATHPQLIDYVERDRASCLVKIAQALRRFHDLTNVTTIRLGPSAPVDAISSLLDEATFSCTFQVLSGTVQGPAQKASVFPIKGGLFVQLRGVAPGELVRITIQAKGRIWRSDYESVDTVDVRLVVVALSLQQSQEYLGNGRWRWSVWIDGTDGELDSIDNVTYFLHPTFHNPVRVVGDRTTKFRLETSGWGTFTMHAKAMHRDGQETELTHELLLLYPDGTATLA